MTVPALLHPVPPAPSRGLRAYLLGRLEFDALIGLQRRLVYEVGGSPETGALIVCDHPPGITIGREGSRAHVRPGPAELHARRWPVRWVSRGGGVVLHQTGQVTCYPVIALARAGLTPARYLVELQRVVVDLLRGFEVRAEHLHGPTAVAELKHTVPYGSPRPYSSGWISTALQPWPN